MTPSSLTKLQVKYIYDALVAIRNHIKKPKHVYLVEKIRAGMRAEYDAINEMLKPSEEIMEYDKKRFALCHEYCLKDEAGVDIIVNKSYQIDPKRIAEFEAQMAELNEANKDLLEENKERGKQIDEDLKETADYKLPATLVPLSALPEGISGEIVEALMPVLVEDEE